MPKSRYASAGSLYPVQIYIYIKPDRIEGLADGTYYYDPKGHRLIVLSEAARIDGKLFDLTNRALFAEAAFAIFLVGQRKAISPLYGDLAGDFCKFEAGIISHLLESAAPPCEIGLCQVGDVAFDHIRQFFDLDDGHLYLHCLLGGGVDPQQMTLKAFLEEAQDLHALTESIRQSGDVTGTASPPSYLKSPQTQVNGQDVSHNLSNDPFKVEGDFVAELRDFLKEKLPDYMMPSAFVMLERLPLSSNGKVDRGALPDPDEIKPELTRDFVAPRNPIERRVAKVWVDLLGVEQIGVHDNFFSLGGDSLRAIKLISRLRAEFQVEIPVRNLFEMTTVARQAELVATIQWAVQTAAPGNFSGAAEGDFIEGEL